MKELQKATFGGGCFWCIEAVIQRLKGVQEVVSGYAGGNSNNPSYQEVCYGDSGHAEVVQVTFDVNEISYKDLLTVFMTSHNPTTKDRQGADVGTQYRSIILWHDDKQRIAAEEFLAELGDLYSDPIVTELVKLDAFYAAEAYHQDYYKRNSGKGYCTVVIDPKLSKLRSQYADKLKEKVV